jgi:F-type H+-transporting ATPase subunit delta
VKISKDAARAARQLFRLSHKDGRLEGDLIKKITSRIAESKPRGYLGMLQEYARLLRLESEKSEALVESAIELGAQTGNDLVNDLRAKYGGELKAEFRVNPDLLGGIRVKVGSDVWDGSVRARLNELKNKL